MSLHTEKMILKGRLEEMKQQKMQLAGAIDAKVRAAKTALATSAVTPIEQLDLAGADQLLGEAAGQQIEYREICEKIREIERELA